MTRILGIDVGGTFTDFVSYDSKTQELEVWKTSSTPDDPSDGILNGMAQKLSEQVEYMRFGTTVATNAILERKGSTVAFVTTQGFKDVPFIQRGKRKSHYDITWIKSKPLVKRRDCYEIDERITPREGVYKPLNEAQARTVAKSINSDPDIEAIAICLLCSYVFPEHERRLKAIFEEECPTKPVSISYELLPKWKEHERSSTTIADAYIKPIVSQNLLRLQDRLNEAGDIKKVAVIKSNGGETTLEGARQYPIHLSLSGPTGGVIGAKYIAGLSGVGNLVTLDMGGTSTDVSTIVGARESFTTSYEIEFGVPIQIPMLDIRTMGAGGGSIAWIDKGGMLRVGPQSAGAQPGPACYGRGGQEPTVTDANVVLGRINPSNFLGGTMSLDVDAAKNAIKSVADQIEVSIDEAAIGIVQIANNNMVGALRMVLTERGLDPRDFTLLAFGGAGPVHITDVMHSASIPSGIVPNFPGQFSAFGFIMTDARVDLERTAPMTSKAFNAEHASRVLSDLVTEAKQSLSTQGYQANLEIYRSLEMRYFGQNHELEVAVEFDSFDEQTILDVWQQFHSVHKTRYNFDIPGETIELISIKVTAVSLTPKPNLLEIEKSTGTVISEGTRLVRYDSGHIETPIYSRELLKAGDSFNGPAIIEEGASVTIIRPEYEVKIDLYGNILIGEIATK